MKDVSWLRRPQFTFTHCRLTIRHKDDQYHDDHVDDDVDDAENSGGDFGNCDDAASPTGKNMIMMGLVGEGEGDCDESWVSRVFDIRSHVKALFAGPSVEMRHNISSIMEL